jgi:NMD protein affecting ribosome stability and mRNA decay
MCKRCYFADHPLFEVTDTTLRLQICPNCSRFRQLTDNEKTWQIADKKTLKDILIQSIYFFIITEIEENEDIDFFIDFIELPSNGVVGRKKKARIELVGYPRIEQDESEENEDQIDATVAPIELIYSMGMCPDCAQIRAGYHNSVLQLRVGMHRRENAVLVDQVLAEVQKFAADSEIHGIKQIASIEKVQGGYDLKFVGKNFGSTVVNHLKHLYPGEVKESFKVVRPDKETGGNLKRLFFLFRLYPIFKGDVLIQDKSDELGLVYRITPKMLHIFLLPSGKVMHIKPSQFDQEMVVFQHGADDPITFEVVSINEDDGTLNLMNMNTYAEKIINNYPWLSVEQEGDVIEAFRYQEVLFFLPKDISAYLEQVS